MSLGDTLALIGIFVAIAVALYHQAMSRPTTKITQNFYGDVNGSVTNNLTPPPDASTTQPALPQPPIPRLVDRFLPPKPPSGKPSE
jgi:hypothetical protein